MGAFGNSFQGRVIVCTAITGLVLGGIDIIAAVTAVATVLFSGFTVGRWGTPWAMQACGAIGAHSVGLLLCIACFGVLARRVWGRWVATSWAALFIVFHAINLIGILGIMSDGTYSGSGVAFYNLWNLVASGFVRGFGFPFLLLAILWQREYLDFCTGMPLSRFEVMPAVPADDQVE